jgi:hypothetical protein
MSRIPFRCAASILVAGMSVGVVSPQCLAQQTTPEHAIKEEDPPIGSRIRRDEVNWAALPVNQTYQQLTPEERAHVNSWYEHVAPGDEPPFPLDGMRSILDVVRKGQEKLLVTGKLYLVATVEPSGKVSAVKAYGSPNPEMAKFASEVLLLTKFKPAVCGGRPCRMDFPLSYNFKVE